MLAFSHIPTRPPACPAAGPAAARHPCRRQIRLNVATYVSILTLPGAPSSSPRRQAQPQHRVPASAMSGLRERTDFRDDARTAHTWRACAAEALFPASLTGAKLSCSPKKACRGSHGSSPSQPTLICRGAAICTIRAPLRPGVISWAVHPTGLVAALDASQAEAHSERAHA